MATAAAAPERALARASPKSAPAGTKVVVLGGNGFVGSKVCEMLVEAGEWCDPLVSDADQSLDLAGWLRCVTENS